MHGFIEAIQFLTIFQFKKTDEFRPGRSLAYFPLAGLTIGFLLALVDTFARMIWPLSICGLVDVGFLVWITGALHVDGLGDSADGLYGNRSKERALEIMKDSRMGAMGVVAIFLGLGFKWAGIAAIDATRFLTLAVVPAFSRSAQVIALRILPYGRAEGTGSAFAESSISLSRFWGLLFPVIICLFMGRTGFLLIFGFIALTAGSLLYFKRRVNCITGDMIGALNEVCECGLFLAAAVGGAS